MVLDARVTYYLLKRLYSFYGCTYNTIRTYVYSIKKCGISLFLVGSCRMGLDNRKYCIVLKVRKKSGDYNYPVNFYPPLKAKKINSLVCVTSPLGFFLYILAPDFFPLKLFLQGSVTLGRKVVRTFLVHIFHVHFMPLYFFCIRSVSFWWPIRQKKYLWFLSQARLKCRKEGDIFYLFLICITSVFGRVYVDKMRIFPIKIYFLKINNSRQMFFWIRAKCFRATLRGQNSTRKVTRKKS